MDEENSLWLRVAALRGIALPERAARASVSGERFRVQVASESPRHAAAVAHAAHLARDPRCQGVVGEITVRRRRTTLPYGWRRGLT